MQFADETKASHLLQNVSYYRFSGYWYPFLADKQTHIFKPDTNFETAFNLYKFDRELRQLIISELEKIEVAVRSKMAYVLSTACDAFWIDNANLFVDSAKHRVTLAKISEELSRSDEEFIMSFKSKYTNPFPPSFILLEITSFGALSRLYENLKSGKAKKDIANLFCLSDKVFASWLHSLVYVRNVCAHHARIWNKWLQVQPLFPKHTSNIWLIDKTVSNRRMYYVLSMIIYLLNTVNPKHTFRQKLAALFAKYPNVDKRAMGFPVDWENEPLWSAPIHLQQSV
ncbi:CAAX amino protease [Bacteroidia bacterium]|nr:CAAX amino protease [Bacteroidia bacterium]